MTTPSSRTHTINPLGTDGFEFVEFSAPEKGVLEPVFTQMGFSLVATKGTAGAAVQCMNIALGLDEAAGLVVNGVAP